MSYLEKGVSDCWTGGAPRRYGGPQKVRELSDMSDSPTSAREFGEASEAAPGCWDFVRFTRGRVRALQHSATLELL